MQTCLRARLGVLCAKIGLKNLHTSTYLRRSLHRRASVPRLSGVEHEVQSSFFLSVVVCMGHQVLRMNLSSGGSCPTRPKCRSIPEHAAILGTPNGTCEVATIGAILAQFFAGYGNGRREISLLVPSSAPYADLPALMAACGPTLPSSATARTTAIG